MHFIIAFASVLLSGTVAAQQPVVESTSAQVCHSLPLSVHVLTNYLNLANISAFASPRNVTPLVYGPIAQMRMEMHSRQSAVIPRTQIFQPRVRAVLVSAKNPCPSLLSEIRRL